MEHWHGQDPKRWNLGKFPDPNREGIATCTVIPPSQVEGSCLRSRSTHEGLT